jgi:hypothetical protein
VASIRAKRIQDVKVFLCGIKLDTICRTPLVQLVLATIQMSQYVPLASERRKHFETIEVVCKHSFRETSFDNWQPGVSVKTIPKNRPEHRPLENHVHQIHRGGFASIDNHLGNAILQPAANHLNQSTVHSGSV